MMKLSPLTILLALSIAAASCTGSTAEGGFNRPAGIYPGSPDENPAPVLKADKTERNIALRKAVYQSSAVDYNYTGQLVTDGIVSEGPVQYFRISDQDGLIDKKARECILDFGHWSRYTIQAKKEAILQVDMVEINQPVEQFGIKGYLISDSPVSYSYALQGSHDGNEWTVLSSGRDSKKLDLSYKAPQSMDYKSYRAVLTADSAIDWLIIDLGFYNEGQEVQMLTHEYFNSCWVSEGKADEWLYVDFGTRATAEEVTLRWINKAVSGAIETSDDARSWKKVASLPGGEDLTDRIALPRGTKARYLRVSMDKSADGQNFVLSEMEVKGKGALEPVAKAQPEAAGGRLALTGGQWKLERATEVDADGSTLSLAGYDDSSWLTATVPGTVLKSFIEAGAVPNPDYSDNQTAISDSYFLSDFWYRDEFVVDESFIRDRIFLDFDGINWKADIWLNGTALGRMEGSFITGSFDVTSLIKTGQTNALAVLIHRNDHPGATTEQSYYTTDTNGGHLGHDNPTFHASVGWDWIPTIRGRNIGIWNDVALVTKGDVSISEPFVNSTLNLPDTTEALLQMQAVLTNHGSVEKQVSWTWEMDGNSIGGGSETLAPGECRTVTANRTVYNPELWWPAGYGDPVLHDTRIAVSEGTSVSDETCFKTGIRQMTYDDSEGILYMYVNGRRFIGRGGNWGFSESNLSYRAREYDIAAAFHADMHFTMIRNWVGMTGDDEFYEACDRHGIMVWQDFWLANPADGPDPDDEEMFMANAQDMVLRIRNHPSIGLYCGRNEGMPPAGIDKALSEMLPELHPGIVYIPDSADGVVSGRGPYTVKTAKTYFTLPHAETFHSERGLPNVMTYESMSLAIPEDRNWPVNDLWGLHDFTQGGAQNGANFTAFVDKALGASDNARQFTSRAQLINYDGYRAAFESRSSHRQGLLLWMSHSAWPSMVWQTYDYYFEPTAGYFGCKKANEPLHIQWNPVAQSVEVVNLSAGDRTALKAVAEVYALMGEKIMSKEVTLDAKEDSTNGCMELDLSSIESEVYYLVLKLHDGEQCVSDNFYILGREKGNVQAIMSLPEPDVRTDVKLCDMGDCWKMSCTLTNASQTPALMQRLIATGAQSGERILPALYSDNYLNLLPGASQEVTVTLRKADCRGEKPAVIIKGLE